MFVLKDNSPWRFPIGALFFTGIVGIFLLLFIYRYLLPAFRDLYGVDFDTITAEQAETLNGRIYENYQTDDWLQTVPDPPALEK